MSTTLTSNVPTEHERNSSAEHIARLPQESFSKPCTQRVVLMLLLFAMWPCGCTYSGGELLYALGVGTGPLVDAEFQLTDGPVLILIDDPSQRIDWPPTMRYLFDDLAQELLKHQAAKKIIPLQTVDQLKQTTRHFSKRGCREIGELAKAEQVLWIEVQDFLAEQQITEVGVAAYLTVTVKVINALEKENRGRARLWPASPRGEEIAVSMTGSEVALAKTKDGTAKDLARRLAVKTARRFYEHRLSGLEVEE